MRGPSQRRLLGVLFLVLGLALLGVALAAAAAGAWVIAVAAVVLGLWLGSTGLAALRPH